MKSITIGTIVKKNRETVWDSWTDPKHVTQWNHASEDWHCPKASNDVQVGGRFSFTMAAKNGRESFDFCGVYSKVEERKVLQYVMDDGRKAKVTFEEIDENTTKVTETFEMEGENTEELQRTGWSAILENFRLHTEAL